MKMASISVPYASRGVHLGPSIESHLVDAFIPYGVTELMKDAEPVPILAGITALDGYSIFMFEESCEFQKRWILDDENFCDFLGASLHWESDVVKRCFREIRDEYFDLEELKKLLKKDESRLSKLKNTLLCGSKRESEASGSGLAETIETKEARLLQADEAVAKFITDLWFHRFYDNFKLGGTAKKSAPLYVYEFDFVSDLNPSKEYRKKMTSASHLDDLVYLFCSAYNRQMEFPFNEDIKKKITTICSLWASFCKTGASLDEEWLPHTEEEPRYLSIGEELKMQNKRLNENRWAVLNARVREVEREKEQKSHRRTWNTPAAIETDIEKLRKILDEMSSELKSTASLEKEVSCPGTFDASEHLESAAKSKCLQPSTSLPGTSDFSEHSKSKEGSNLATLLEVPPRDTPKRHSPSRSPTSDSKTCKDESSEPKRERTSESGGAT